MTYEKGKIMEMVQRSMLTRSSGEGGRNEWVEHREYLRQCNYSV